MAQLSVKPNHFSRSNKDYVVYSARKVTYSAKHDSLVHCCQRQLRVSMFGKLHKRIQIAAGLSIT